MALTLTGVPQKVSKADLVALARSLGFDENDLVEMTIDPQAITATVMARNAEGKHFLDGADVAIHTITIPVED